MNNDLISREELKKHKVYVVERHEYVVPVYNIDNAPTIERQQGEWIKSQGGYVRCNLCHKAGCFGYEFCPNCGAYMRKNKRIER